MHKDFCVTMKQPFSCSVGITHVVSTGLQQSHKFKTASVAISELFILLLTERREPEQVNRNVQQQQWKWIYTTFYFRVTWEWRQPGGRDSKHLYSWKHPETTNTQTAFPPALPHPSFPYSDYSQVQWIMSLTLVVTMQRQSMFIRQKRSSQYIVRFITTYLIPEGKMWEAAKRCQYEEPRR